jgi:hypothetical protein
VPIEFLDEDAPELPEPHQPARRGLLRVAAGVAVAAAALAWALTRPDGGATTAAPRPTPTPTAHPSRAQLGPTTVRCGTGGPVTTELASAMQHFLPAVKIDNLRVYRCVRGSGPDGRIIFEAVSSRYRGMNIDVEAALRGAHPPEVPPQLGAEGGRFVVHARIDTIAAGLEVSVVDWARPGDHRPPPAAALTRLADFVSLNVIL